MKRDAVQDTTTPTVKSGKNSPRARSQRAVFLAAFADMSWKLAIVILVPMLGGFKLDQVLHTTPALSIIGFILAMAGLYVVLKQAMDTADERFNPRGSK